TYDTVVLKFVNGGESRTDLYLVGLRAACVVGEMGQIACNTILLSAFIPYALIRIPLPKMRPDVRIAAPHAGCRSRLEMPQLRLQKGGAAVFHLLRRGMRDWRLRQVHLRPVRRPVGRE